MRKKTLILKFIDTQKEYLFEDKVFVIKDKKLIENLEKPSIKNYESKLVIKTMDDTHISDVIQIKVNMSETGYFLVSFAKGSLEEEKRKSLLEEISGLKSNAVQTNSTQLRKAKKLCEILNKYKPIYVTFINDGEFRVNATKLSLEHLEFPLLLLNKPIKKKFFIGFKHKKVKLKKKKEVKEDGLQQEEKEIKQPKKIKQPRLVYSPFSLFEVDYIFVFLFAALGSFGVLTCVFEAVNKESIAIFLGILGLAFALVLAISVQSTVYKKGKLINPWLRVYLCFYIIVGIVGGIIGGYFISKGVLKTEIEDFDYKKVIIISSLISVPAMLSSLLSSMLINMLVKKKYQKGNEKGH